MVKDPKCMKRARVLMFIHWLHHTKNKWKRKHGVETFPVLNFSSINLPAMSAYNCSDPSALSNGYFVIAKPYYVDGDRVYYYCQWTYFLQGNPIRECDGDTGNWTGKAPTCTTTTTTSTTEAPVNGIVCVYVCLNIFCWNAEYVTYITEITDNCCKYMAIFFNIK